MKLNMKNTYSEETNRRRSETLKKKYASGQLKQHNKGKTKENYEPMRIVSEKRKGKHNSPLTEFKKNGIPHNKGKTIKNYEPTKRSAGKNKGRIATEETREKNSKSMLNFYKNNTLPTGCGFKKGHTLQQGEKHWNWQDGLSFEEYPQEFNKKLKEQIKERNNYTCQLCLRKNKLCVHHIDYNKKNNNPNNLISLCISCHVKTNYNRQEWIEYFRGIA